MPSLQGHVQACTLKKMFNIQINACKYKCISLIKAVVFYMYYTSTQSSTVYLKSSPKKCVQMNTQPNSDSTFEKDLITNAQIFKLFLRFCHNAILACVFSRSFVGGTTISISPNDHEWTTQNKYINNNTDIYFPIKCPHAKETFQVDYC